MKIIVCLDDKNGMLFNKRRQSSDAVLCQRILALSAGNVLWMNGYSQRLFADMDGTIRIDESFLERAGQHDWCFVEDLDAAPYVSRSDEIVIFRWNRVYPADMRFPMHLLDHWTKTETAEFAGNSHDKITQEVYRP